MLGNLHSGACLTYLCIKSCLLVDCRRKNFHSVYLQKKYFLAERGHSWAKAFEEESKEEEKKSHFQQAASSQMCKEMQNSISKFYQFQTDSRQSPSGYVPACLARARRMAREAAITEPEWRRERPMAKRSRIWHPITVVGKYKSPPLLLLTRLLTVHWIKQQSELSSSLHWDVGHWLHPIHSGKIAEAWYYSLHTNINTSDMYINYTINCTSDR